MGGKLKLTDIRMYRETKSADLPDDLKEELFIVARELEKMGFSIYRTENGTLILTFKEWEVHHVVSDIGVKQYIYERSDWL